jgi:hypothetical protein
MILPTQRSDRTGNNNVHFIRQVDQLIAIRHSTETVRRHNHGKLAAKLTQRLE